ncbi:MAG TPA: hypothetical protein VFA34_00240 [Actinomycetota bacterium]|jgi:hypothetical protein|nr:hypothetical protein [Actinomycetota bacterium]
MIVTSSCQRESPLAADTREEQVLLTASKPTRQFSIMGTGFEPEFVRIQIVAITNVSRQGFVLSLALEALEEGGRQLVEIAKLSPFPVDRPGSFLIRIPRRVRRILGAGPAHMRLVIGLIPVRMGTPLVEPLRVVATLPTFAKSAAG